MIDFQLTLSIFLALVLADMVKAIIAMAGANQMKAHMKEELDRVDKMHKDLDDEKEEIMRNLDETMARITEDMKGGAKKK